MLRNLCIIFLIGFFFNPSWADTLPEDECQRWRQAQNTPAKLSVNAFTPEKARRANAVIVGMIDDKAPNFDFDAARYRQAQAMIKGYLLRKQLLNARKNREHDADEMTDFCIHWSEMAYGP